MPIRIFIVEDSNNSRSLMAEALSAMQEFEVVGEASTEAEASFWLTQHAGRWDVAVLDLLLAQGSGFGVLRRLQDMERRGKLVVFSGFVSDVIRSHCIRLGAAAVFDKAESLPFLAWLREEAEGTHSRAQLEADVDGPTDDVGFVRRQGSRACDG